MQCWSHTKEMPGKGRNTKASLNVYGTTHSDTTKIAMNPSPTPKYYFYLNFKPKLVNGNTKLNSAVHMTMSSKLHIYHNSGR
jgi:hypothetical protein